MNIDAEKEIIIYFGQPHAGGIKYRLGMQQITMQDLSVQATYNRCILQSIYFIPQHVIHNVKGLKATVLSGMWSCAAINPN